MYVAFLLLAQCVVASDKRVCCFWLLTVAVIYVYILLFVYDRCKSVVNLFGVALDVQIRLESCWLRSQFLYLTVFIAVFVGSTAPFH